MECLTRRGFDAGAVTGTVLDLGRDLDPAAWLAEQGLSFEAVGGPTEATDAPASTADGPTHYRLGVRGVAVVLHRSPTTRPHEPEEAERRQFLGLFEESMARLRPDVVVNFGGDALATEVRRRARAGGAAVVFALHNFNYCLWHENLH
jgi:hypothetical protein